MRVALIGGTGIDEMAWLLTENPVTVGTPWGHVAIVEASIGGRDVVFVPRHGFDHSTPPGQVNYRAQIAALKKLSVSAVISVCAVGSLRADLLAGSFTVLSDFIDLTRKRIDTFFDSPYGPVVHTDLTEPYCPSVSGILREVCTRAGTDFEPRATYIGVDGPRYETPAEIRLYASWGGHVVGMTNLPEVVLAREAGLCYGALGVVTNMACGMSPTQLNHDHVRAAMAEAAGKLRDVISDAVKILPETRGCTCGLDCHLYVK